jgi:hypothetical protein
MATPRQVTSAARNEGVFLLPRGTKADMGKVPPWDGLLYIDVQNNVLYAHYGNAWRVISSVAQVIKTDGQTIDGDGINTALSVKSVIPDFVDQYPYEEGNCVFHSINGVQGIYRRTNGQWELLAASRSTLVAGMMVRWPWKDDTKDRVPSGYFPCDGRELLRNTYTALFAAIGYDFTPPATTSDLFCVPQEDNTIIYAGVI